MRKPLLILAASLVLAIAASGARAGEDLTAMTNSDRAANNLRALSTARDLQSFAQQRAEEMARAGKLWHSQDLGMRISNWKRLGENIGRGASLSGIQRNFMASPTHRDNILFPDFRELGVGVAKDGKGYLYVSVVFREPAPAAAPAPPPSPAPAPAPQPAPAPRPRQATARPRLAAPAPKRDPQPKPAPAPTTTTTPTTVPPAPVAAPEPPPPPPVPEPVPAPPAEVAPRPAFRPRPAFQNPDFLAVNFLGSSLPERSRDLPFGPDTAGTVIGLAGVFGGVHAGARRWLSLRRGLTGNRDV